MRMFATQIVGLLTGFAALLGGLFLLDREPLFGVLGILGAMSLLLIPAAALWGTDVTRSRGAEQEPVSSDAASSGCIHQ